MSKSSVAIIGAGPAGLAAASVFSKAGFYVDIYESSKNIGGLSLSLELWGKTVELGPHFLEFISDRRVKTLIYDPYKDDYFLYKRNTKIYVNQSLFYYPPKVLDLIRNLGVKAFAKLSLNIILARLTNNGAAETAEELSINSTGELAHAMFIKDYSEKIWGRPCSELSPIYLKRLIGYEDKGLSISSLINKFLPDRSKYYTQPKNGMSIIWKKLARSLSDNGANIYLSCSINKLIVNSNNSITGIDLGDNNKIFYDHIVATTPVMAIADLLPNQSDKISNIMSAMHYRSVVSVYLKFPDNSLFDEQCIFLYNNDIRATKITNFNNFPRKDDEANGSVILFEYWCDYDDEIWNSEDSKLISIVKKDASLLQGVMNDFDYDDIFIKRFKSVYPVPDIHYYEKVDAIRNILSAYSNFSYVGRGASGHFNYSTAESMSDSISLSKNLVAQLA